ncbi:bifunctional 3-phenylpropionate/cinnamic acid dioxygenase ferredoxin subunit [Amycolatopsis pithecellobii]|uniref:Bifunctional 3-phenylpropionate/cinnamic acid dioxygenase ferredoxin subunit n=1 Tax=Amycolatopsis pithecellobii TaxID=664692 RepID=A0A6N7Z512_9PSEU|nr:bifunctional 3-phenylpropionate/cinnamic acid dioxygenase ferredoxin subunit [Amycolatopsis pithecellobii]MTD55681.1 bifunctional 3-phenylpropionate/cinnamic acid dioxygenase ferredoxin subunit [Amycolatopsis pithecellobii]
MTWIRACEAAAVAEGETAVVERPPAAPVAVFNVDGDFYATDDTCTHDRYSLADGYIDDDVVECPLHMAKFCIRTGKALSLPATTDLTPYPVKVEGGVVYVDL